MPSGQSMSAKSGLSYVHLVLHVHVIHGMLAYNLNTTCFAPLCHRLYHPFFLTRICANFAIWTAESCSDIAWTWLTQSVLALLPFLPPWLCPVGRCTRSKSPV